MWRFRVRIARSASDTGAAPGHAKRRIHLVPVRRQSALEAGVELPEDPAGGPGRIRRADDGHLVPLDMNGNVQVLLDSRQVAVVGPEELDEEAVVVERHPDGVDVRGGHGGGLEGCVQAGALSTGVTSIDVGSTATGTPVRLLA